MTGTWYDLSMRVCFRDLIVLVQAPCVHNSCPVRAIRKLNTTSLNLIKTPAYLHICVYIYIYIYIYIYTYALTCAVSTLGSFGIQERGLPHNSNSTLNPEPLQTTQTKKPQSPKPETLKNPKPLAEISKFSEARQSQARYLSLEP